MASGLVLDHCVWLIFVTNDLVSSKKFSDKISNVVWWITNGYGDCLCQHIKILSSSIKLTKNYYTKNMKTKKLLIPANITLQNKKIIVQLTSSKSSFNSIETMTADLPCIHLEHWFSFLKLQMNYSAKFYAMWFEYFSISLFLLFRV